MVYFTRRLLICIVIAYLFMQPISSLDYCAGEAETAPIDARGLTNLYRAPGAAGAGSTIYDEKYIALTFDDGPHKKYTAQILDILAEYGIKATFFIVGRNCEKYPELVAREIDEGHEVGNHTYSHPDIDKLNEGEFVREVLGTEEILHELRSYKLKLFRPPAGEYNIAIDRIIARLNYTAVLWNVDTHDWKCPPASLISKEVLKKIKPGYIILMHDYVVGNSGTPAALKEILPKLIEQGYRFVTVSELIKMSGTPEE